MISKRSSSTCIKMEISCSAFPVLNPRMIRMCQQESHSLIHFKRIFWKLKEIMAWHQHHQHHQHQAPPIATSHPRVPVAVPGSCRISQKSTSPAFRMWSFKSCQDVLYGKLPTSGCIKTSVNDKTLLKYDKTSKKKSHPATWKPKLSSECHAKTRVFPDPFPWTLGSENSFQYTKKSGTHALDGAQNYKTCALQPWRCSASDFRWL